MELTDGVEILDGLPMIYMKKLGAVVCTDTHLGYEGVKADTGTFLPKVNLKHIKEDLKKAVDRTGTDRIIIDGDVKNEFSQVHVEEFNEFYDLVNYLRDDVGIKTVTVIKGNHDNFIDRLKLPLRIELYTQEALINGDYLFFHGEEAPHTKEGKLLVMGHVHPSIAIYNKLGVKEKLKCFLWGRLRDGRRIVVLPAMNYFAEGFSVNMEKGIGRLAPIFDSMLDVDSMEALCVGEGETLNFGKIGELRDITL